MKFSQVFEKHQIFKSETWKSQIMLRKYNIHTSIYLFLNVLVNVNVVTSTE